MTLKNVLRFPFSYFVTYFFLAFLAEDGVEAWDCGVESSREVGDEDRLRSRGIGRLTPSVWGFWNLNKKCDINKV